MRVFIVTSETFPYGMSSSKRILCYAKALRNQNVPCIVYSLSRIKHGNEQVTSNMYEGISFSYFTKRNLKKGSLFYSLESILIRLRLFLCLSRLLSKGDVVFGYMKDTTIIKMIIFLAHKKGAKYIQELCEFPSVSISNKNDADTARRNFESKVLHHCDGIITISNSLTEYASHYKSNACIIEKIPILVDFYEYELEDTSSDYEIPYVFHSGTLTEQKDGFVGMIEAFGKAVNTINKNVHFISTGTLDNAPNKEEIINCIERLRIQDKVIFTGYISDEKLKELLSGASVVIVNKYINSQNTYCFSTKLGEYMAAGKAIIITKVGEALNWLTDNEDAYLVEPQDVELLSKTIARAFNNDDERKRIGNNARKSCLSFFHYDNYGRVLVDFFERVQKN